MKKFMLILWSAAALIGAASLALTTNNTSDGLYASVDSAA